jgi:hypothetical protein
MHQIMIIVLAVYTLVHGGVYLWFQAGHHEDESAGAGKNSDDTSGASLPRQRRVASGIHHSESRFRRLVGLAMALAATVLAGMAVAALMGEPVLQ